MARVGPYELLRPLGQGAMGEVFLARGADGREVALKLLHALTPLAQARFRREAQLLLRLPPHPHLVRALDAGEADGRPYLALELIPAAGTLADRLHGQGPLPLDEAIRVATQLAGALAHVHAHGLLHRDVKPGNVLVTAEGRPVLTDFGLVRELDSRESAALTRTGVFLGTPGYWPPEQARGELDALAPPADVYALGATLHELITGQLPLPAGSLAEALRNAESTTPPPPSRLRAGVWPALDALVLRCLEKEPARRFASADELAAALAALRGPARTAPSRPLRTAPLLLLPAAALALLWTLAGPPPPPPARPSADPDPASATSSPQRLVLQPGPAEGQDTYVTDYGWRVNDNYGATGDLLLGDSRSEFNPQRGHNRILIRFDLTPLPPAARVTSARLELWPRLPPGGELRVRVQALDAPWTEGTSTLDRTLDGVAWSGRFQHSPNPATASDAPEFDQPGVTGEVVSEATLEAGQAEWIGLDATAAVRAWQRLPSTNHGLRLAGTEERPDYSAPLASFYSSDAWDAAPRPRLVIDYEGPPPLPLASIAGSRDVAKGLLANLEGAPADLQALRRASRACAAAPDWATPFLVRTGIVLRRVDGSAPPPDPEQASETLKSALAREVLPDELPRVRALLRDILAAASTAIDPGTQRPGRRSLIRLVGLHVRGACPIVRDDPELGALLARYGQE